MEYSSDAIGTLLYSNAQVLLLFGDREEGLAEARAAAERAGCRIAAEAAIAGAAARFDAQLGADAALVMASGPSAELDALLGRIGAAAREGRLRGAVVAPPAMIDALAFADLPLEIDHLFDPSADVLCQALAGAIARPSAAVHDLGRGGVAVLQQLSEEASRIASALASLSEEDKVPARTEDIEPPTVTAASVRAIIRARRLRDQYFPAEMFADPGFDMLLDLYAARLEGSRVAVSSLCIAAAVPATTALRWIRALTEQGLFVRSADPSDGRRVYISLSDDAATAMGRYLIAAQRGGPLAI